jgi:hypothetical protein
MLGEMKQLLALGMLLLAGLPLWAGPVELGTVKWLRDYEAGLKTVKESGKPMFLLFQEVPG